jgi:methyltransferase of ATP-grasp peptide maturase system
MSTIDVDWGSRARLLADELTAAGKLRSQPWRDAVCAVPRHVFVPSFFRQAQDGTWQPVESATEEGRAAVYSNIALITALQDTDGGAVARSSSSMPGLMTRMLEALDVHDGHRVLEIGTGTGYNAALLSHRLGDQRVFSVDVEPDLADLARTRLAALGYRPTLVAADGGAGLPEHAPYDRIIATCAVTAVPWAWAEQTREGGVILTDVKPARGAGSLVRLIRYRDRLEGRFDPTYAAFMVLRHAPGETPPDVSSSWDRATGDVRTTTVHPQTPWNSLVVWFLASFQLGPMISYGYQGAPPTASFVATPDGSWAEVALSGDGTHQVAEGGARRLWRIIEQAHARWDRLGRPGWERFGLTVTPEGAHTVWLDEPGHAVATFGT